MKKLIKATALLLAVTMTLTACRNENSAGNLEKEYKAYMNAEVTEVEDKPYKLNGIKGTYSGDWKGNRPEGEGTLWLNDNEYYYSENWSNGDINGYGEIKRFGSDGKLRLFTGECAYSEPAGQGIMDIGEDGDEYRMVIDGDFNDPPRLLYYTLDENGGCVDVGGYINGEYESYVENSNVTGSTYLIDRQPVGGATYKSRNGYYIGQVNENGQPNGYGYYAEEYELNPGIIEQLTSCTYHAVGSWKNGKLEGYFTDVLIGKGTVIKRETGFFGNIKETKYSVTNSTRREGRVKNDKLVGNNTISTTLESNPQRPNEDGVLITTMNYDTRIKMVERINIDESHSYEWLHMNNDTFADEGEYIKYNKDGEMTIHRTLTDGVWTELMDLEKAQREARDRLIAYGAVAAFFGVSVAFCIHANRSAAKNFDNSSAGKWLADYKSSLAQGAQQRAEDSAKYYETKKKAEDALSRGYYNEASKLYDEADKYSYALSWLER